MLNVGQLKNEDDQEFHDIYVDIDDSGWVHIKQDDDWVSLRREYVVGLMNILAEAGHG